MAQYRTVDGLSALADEFDEFLIDQFGVLHDGMRPYQGATECLARLKELGKNVVLLSNSGKRVDANIVRLADLGFERMLFDHVVTSGEVAWQGIVDGTLGPPFSLRKRMFLVGHENYDYGFESIGIELVADPATSDFIMIAASRAPMMSLNQYGSMLAAAAASGIPALCCNPDRMMVTSEGLQPSAGEIAIYYERLGGKVVFVGKPYAAMYAFAKRQAGHRDSVRSLAIGDSIEHDIRGGHIAGLKTALVLKGLSSGLAGDKLDKRLGHYGTAPDFVMPGLVW
jgi:HAD superfamily hydrolase (TIGR01459 family)